MGDNVNLYLYCKDSPINYTDRDGKRANTVLIDSSVDFSGNNSGIGMFRSLDLERLRKVGEIADEVRIYGTGPYNGFISLQVHTEMVFFRNGQPLAAFGSAVFTGWGEHPVSKVEGGWQMYSSSNVAGCIEGLKDSAVSNGYAGICWVGASACVRGSVLYGERGFNKIVEGLGTRVIRNILPSADN